MLIPRIRPTPNQQIEKRLNPVIDALNAETGIVMDSEDILSERQADGTVKLKLAPAVMQSLSSGGGGGGAADNLVTVSGAVNGAPATLNVQTDGNGWDTI